MTHVEESTAALAAWEDWRRCKQRSDQSMSFADCRATAHAWVRFQNLYLGHSNKLSTLPRQLRDLNSGGATMTNAERMLLASLVGLTICAFWIAITWRAWG